MTGGESEFQWSYVVLAVLVPAAILVYYLGNVRVQRRLFNARGAEPQGRRMPRGTLKADPQFGAFVSRALERGLVTPIAGADAQPVMVRGTITASDANLGGAPGRECVWRNRSGAPREAAVAAEFVTIADATGRAVLENLGTAEVIAPEERASAHVTGLGLYLGDVVEVIGRFNPERIGQDADPTRLVYGSLGSDGNLYVRVCERPSDKEAGAAHASNQGAVSSSPSPASPSAPAPQESSE